MGPSWSSVIERPRRRIFYVHKCLLTDQQKLLFTSRWTPLGGWFDVVNCLPLQKNKYLMSWRIRGVRRVTVKKDGAGIPTNTLFLTLNIPELPKLIRVSYVQVKVDLFVPNPLRCFGCNKFGHTSDRCKVAQKCVRWGQDKHGPQMCSNCKGPHASSAKDCPVWQKEKEIQRVRVEKRIPSPEARRFVEASLLYVLPASAALRYSNVVSRKRVQSVDCQADLSWRVSSVTTRFQRFLLGVPVVESAVVGICIFLQVLSNGV